MFCAEISVGAFVPGKMKSSPGGMLSQAERGRSKFLERISFCFASAWPYLPLRLRFDKLDCVQRLRKQGMYYLPRNCHRRRPEEIRHHLSIPAENVAHLYFACQTRSRFGKGVKF